MSHTEFTSVHPTSEHPLKQVENDCRSNGVQRRLLGWPLPRGGQMERNEQKLQRGKNISNTGLEQLMKPFKAEQMASIHTTGRSQPPNGRSKWAAARHGANPLKKTTARFMTNGSGRNSFTEPSSSSTSSSTLSGEQPSTAQLSWVLAHNSPMEALE